jgi:polysaccharide deacetylase 2 family uncharacterized protein YibQ
MRSVAVRRRWRQAARHRAAAALVFAALFAAGISWALHRHLPSPQAERRLPRPAALLRDKPTPPPAVPPRPLEPAALPLPVPPSRTEPAWRRFAVPAPPAGDRPRVAVVIDDLGLDRRRTAAVIRLPGPLTLSFMTYAQDLAAQSERARRAGEEILLHVPMEPIDRRQNPGPHALEVAMSPDQIREQLRWGLDRLTGFVGINNHMGSRFTADARGMGVVMGELRSRGLIFLDSKTTAASAGIGEAAAAGVPHAARDVFLDDDLSPAAIERQLALLERVARRNGSAIAIGHGHDPTIAALRAWLPTLPTKGLALVPLSAVVRAQMRDPAATAPRSSRRPVAAGAPA